jgi:hypothetical protein
MRVWPLYCASANVTLVTYSPLAISNSLAAPPEPPWMKVWLDSLLWRRGIREPGDLTSAKFRAFAPRDSQQDIDLTAVVRSLIKYFEERQALAPDLSAPERHDPSRSTVTAGSAGTRICPGVLG